MRESWNYIWNYLKKYKTEVYRTAAVSLVVTGIGTAVPAIYGEMLDLILRNNIGNRLYVLMGYWLVIILSTIVMNRYLVRKRNDIAVKCDRDFVAKASVHFIKMPVSYYKDIKIGEIFDKITRAASNLHEIISQVVFITLPRFFAIIIILIYIVFSINYKLIFIVPAMIAIYGLVTVIKTRPLQDYEEIICAAYGTANGNIMDSFSNIKAVKSFTAEGAEEQKYLVGNENIFSAYMPQIFKWSDLTSIQNIVLEVGFFAIIGVSLILLNQKEITAGQIIMLVGYSRMMFEPLFSVSDNYILIRKGIVNIKGIEIFLQEKEEDYQSGKILKDVKGDVRFEEVSFAYNGGQETLKNISFTAKAGDMIALVGRSGAGKSTLVDFLPRFIEPYEGTIYLDKEKLSEINIKSLREKIGIVPQDILLFNDTIENNIRFGNPNATFEDVVRAAKLANADEFIQKLPFGYKTLVGERGYKLSAGQRQRLALARAILKDPKILILDEATSALDSITEKLVQDALKHIVKGRTVFVIAHRLSTIKEADKILVIENGGIAEQGNHNDLASREKSLYNEFLKLQNF